MPATDALDASFYRLIHAISPQSDDSASDRRSRERHSFPTVQMLAPYIGDRLPERHEFREIHCQNISTSGLAYIADEPPQYNRVVIALSTALTMKYVAASIVHVRQLEGSERPRWIIGCRFIDRVNI